MPPTYDPSTRYGFPLLVGSDLVSEIDDGVHALGEAIDEIISTAYKGNFADRPAAGKLGRWFYAEDNVQLFLDTGTAWKQVALSADLGGGGGGAPTGAAGGDLGGTYPNPTVVKASGTFEAHAQRAIAFVGDIDGAKWVNSLGGYALTYYSDNDNATALSGVSSFSYGGRTYRSKLRIGSDGVLDAAGGLKAGGVVVVLTNDARLSAGAAGTATVRALGAGSTQAAAGDDTRFPTAGQKNALVGTSGTPGSTNKYVTDQDTRFSDLSAQVSSFSASLAGKADKAGDTFTGAVSVRRTNIGDTAVTVSKTSDGLARFVQTAGGDMSWGNGTDARDVFFGRSSAGELKVTGPFMAGGTLHAAGHVQMDNGLDVDGAGTTLDGGTFKVQPLSAGGGWTDSDAARFKVTATGIGFHGNTPITRRTITGARDDPTATGALENVLNLLDDLGLAHDNTTAH